MLRKAQIGALAAAFVLFAAWGVLSRRPDTPTGAAEAPTGQPVLSPELLQAGGSAPVIDFDRDVRPILADHCFACHGPDEKARKADLRLDARADAVRGGAIVPGKPDDSSLIQRLTAADPGARMPPGRTGKALTAGQVETLRRWVSAGAPYQPHWAFVNPTRPPLPAARAPGWVRNPIDHFVAARLDREGLTPAPEADRPTLIRRVSLDLTGLPPTPEVVDAFLNDDSPDAYEKVVDRLLGSPHYGERMAVEWLDAARFADTNGFNVDGVRDMSPWRGWVIGAFNRNLPFDRFTVEQLAGDLLPNPTLDQRVATGFNRNHMTNMEPGVIAEEFHTAYVADRVNTTATVWMGLTVACAQCHDHKYDPVTQADYYRLFAYFNNLPELPLNLDRMHPGPVVRLPDPPREAAERRATDGIRALEAEWTARAAGLGPAARGWRDRLVPHGRAVRWAVARPRSAGAANGSVLRVEPDGSVRAGGGHPKEDDYTVEVDLPVQTVTGIRIEFLADETLPGRGPGRAGDGGFFLTDLRVGPGQAWRRVAVDSDQQGGHGLDTLNRPDSPGWGIAPEIGTNHYLVVDLADPVRAADGRLTVRLGFHSDAAGYLLGRFRIAVTGDPLPESGTDPEGWAMVVATADADGAEPHPDVVRHYRNRVWADGRLMRKEIAELRDRLDRLGRAAPNVMVMEEMPAPRDTRVLARGQYDAPGAKVNPGVPAALPPLPPGTPPNRLGLARWLVSDRHPLTARVTVNRYWQMYFGTGLVKTAEDFGAQGELPSHPDLLDWLACEFRETGWDVKHVQRLIVTSATYRQSSRANPEAVSRDPENRLLARMTRARLPAEFLRDQALAAAGLLDHRVGGPSVRIYQPARFWEDLCSREVGGAGTVFTPSPSPDQHRRSLYAFWKRTAPPPTLTAFDAPDREVCTVRRARTNTPLQALVLLNDPTYVEAARNLAGRVVAEGGATPDDRLTFLFRLLTARPPAARERDVLRRVLDAEYARFRGDPDAAHRLLGAGQSPAGTAPDPAELAAWTMVARVVLNLDEVVTRN